MSAAFLALFTELPMDEVNRLSALQGAKINEAKIILANEATILCHGADAAREAMQTAKQTFVSGGGVSMACRRPRLVRMKPTAWR